MRLQFSPQNPRSALKYTERVDVKYQIQRCQVRRKHIDSQHTLVYYSYFKQFFIKFKEHAAIASLVHKVNAPVGEPNRTVETNVQPHNKSLTFSSVTLELLQSQLGGGWIDTFCCFNE